MRICFTNLNVSSQNLGLGTKLNPPSGEFCLMLLQTLPKMLNIAEICEQSTSKFRSFLTMSLSDTQVLVALVIALFPGIMAFRLATELYK